MQPARQQDDSTPTLASLLESAVAGDEKAQTALVSRYDALVVSIVGRFFPDSSEREDLVQESWYRVLKNLHAVREAEALAAFVSSTARNVSINALKAKKRYEPLDPDLQSTRPRGDRVVLTSQLVERALQHLDDKHFTVLALKLYAGMTFAEIAASLSVPQGTISTRYYSAIEKLQRAVGIS